MISLQEARASICLHVFPLDAVPASLASGRGRILRSNIFAPEDFPSFDRSAMDGYAAGLDDTSTHLKIVAEVRPGDFPDFELKPGECVRIFTGGRLPGGASQVFMQEDVSRKGEIMSPLRRDPGALHIRHRGEDARQGDLLLRAGTRLEAPELALLAQAGFTMPFVASAPRVVHLVTGDELVDPALQAGPGEIRDSNSTLMGALLAQAGASLIHQTRCGDSLKSLVHEVEAAASESWDMLLISGGASVGDYDFGVRALDQMGFKIHFRSVNLRPGKPMIFATRGRHIAFVIPGNPVSHFVVFHTAIRLALERLENAEPDWMPVQIPLLTELNDQAGPRDTYWPARVFIEAAQLRVRPLAWRSSGDLCGMIGANALIERLAGSGPIAAGSNVKCLLLPQH